MEKLRRDLFSADIIHSTVDDSARSAVVVEKRGGGYRLRNGRYASRSAALDDCYSHRLAWLEFERKKYMRSYLAVCERLGVVERELRELRGRIADLVK